ncbi:MAG: hypothetical protein KBD56_00925 [Candidatus Eisenbacteria bacterium]|nr:hypothetical protein [Candidatus Eisenbacteria bacterium]
MVHGRAQQDLRAALTTLLVGLSFLLFLGGVLAWAQGTGQASAAKMQDAGGQPMPQENPGSDPLAGRHGVSPDDSTATPNPPGMSENQPEARLDAARRENEELRSQIAVLSQQAADAETESKVKEPYLKALLKDPLNNGWFPLLALVLGIGGGAAGTYFYLRKQATKAKQSESESLWQAKDSQGALGEEVADIDLLRRSLQTAQENVLSAQMQRDDVKANLDQAFQALSAEREHAASLQETLDETRETLARANEEAGLVQLDLEETKTMLGQRQRELVQTTQAKQQLKEDLTYALNAAVPRLCDDLRMRTSVLAAAGASSGGAHDRMATIGALLLRLRRIERCIDYADLQTKLTRLPDPAARHRLEKSLTELSRVATRADEILGSPFALGPIACQERYPSSSTKNFPRWLDQSLFAALEAGVEAKTTATMERLAGSTAQVESAADRLREHLLMNVFSDFFVALMNLRGLQNRPLLLEELHVLNQEIRTCLEQVYNRLPQDIVLGMEYNWAQFDQGSKKSAGECAGIRQGCIAGVQYWGYTTLDGQKIHEKARVDVVE